MPSKIQQQSSCLNGWKSWRISPLVQRFWFASCPGILPHTGILLTTCSSLLAHTTRPLTRLWVSDHWNFATMNCQSKNGKLWRTCTTVSRWVLHDIASILNLNIKPCLDIQDRNPPVFDWHTLPSYSYSGYVQDAWRIHHFVSPLASERIYSTSITHWQIIWRCIILQWMYLIYHNPT